MQGPPSWRGQYYTYRITVFHSSTGKIEVRKWEMVASNAYMTGIRKKYQSFDIASLKAVPEFLAG